MAEDLKFPSGLILVRDSMIKGGAIWQPLGQSLDVSAYGHLDVAMMVPVLNATDLTLELWTGMQTQTDDGWARLHAFAKVTAASTEPQKVGIGPWYGVLRYVRWKVTGLSGTTGSNAQFTLMGLRRP